MAPTICKECGNVVGSTAKNCPHCGARPKSNLSPTRIVLLVLLVISFVAGYYMFEREEAPGTAAQVQKKAEEKKQDTAVQRATVGARILKKEMHGLDNVKLDKALVIADTGTICYQYRASNAQGGVVRGQAIFSGDGESLYTNEMHGFSRLWNKECAGKRGTDTATAIRWSAL